jgi:hypothetical protein
MDEQEPQIEKRGPGRPPKVVQVAPRTVGVDDVIRRRLEGQPFGARRSDVPLKDGDRWHQYAANALADRNQHFLMVNEYGWTVVRIEDLAEGVDPVTVGWEVDATGALCRGPQGPAQDRLYKMTKENHARIAAAKAAANMKGIGSQKAVKESIANAAGSQLGSEAADFTHGNIHVTGADRIVGGA